MGTSGPQGADDRIVLRVGFRRLPGERMRFELLRTVGKARLGRMVTARGVVPTPCFMPVATLGTVKGVAPHELEAQGATMMLANLYHLALRPSVEVIERAGGLHAFCGWRRPILTDSGGYQIFSLAKLRRVDADGVSFRSHLDGDLLRLTPESTVELQRRMGVDVAMMLDECPPWPVSEEEAAASLERTTAWARRSAGCQRGETALFGIVQGSFFPRLRERALEDLVALDFDGYALGGLSVGEGSRLTLETVERFAPSLPAARPRYLMGLGTPDELLAAVRSGIDLFDCVLPARNARHGVLFTRQGLLRIKNARFRDDERPVDPECECPACRRLTRAFLRHLMVSGELTGPVLATLHNLRFYLDFMADLRQSLASGSFEGSAVEVARSYADLDPRDGLAAGSRSVGSDPLDKELS